MIDRKNNDDSLISNVQLVTGKGCSQVDVIFAELNTQGFNFILIARSLYLIILTIYSNNKPPSLNIYSEE